MKIRGGFDQISVPNSVEALPTTEPPEYILMATHGAAAERSGLIKKKKRKFIVKFKTFPTNLG